jgi:hypothetical protein
MITIYNSQPMLFAKIYTNIRDVNNVGIYNKMKNTNFLTKEHKSSSTLITKNKKTPASAVVHYLLLLRNTFI